MNGLLCADDFEIMILSIGSFLVGLLFHSAGHKKMSQKIAGYHISLPFFNSLLKKKRRAHHICLNNMRPLRGINFSLAKFHLDMVRTGFCGKKRKSTNYV